MSDTAALNVVMTKKLRERVRAMSKILHTSTTAIIVSALTREVDAFEDKQRAAVERERQERDERLNRRRASMAPPTSISPAASSIEMTASPTEDFDQLYTHHAKRIAQVVNGDIREVRLRRDEALADFHRRSPLLCPPDQEILTKLEKLTLKYAAQQMRPPDEEEIITIKE